MFHFFNGRNNLKSSFTSLKSTLSVFFAWRNTPKFVGVVSALLLATNLVMTFCGNTILVPKVHNQEANIEEIAKQYGSTTNVQIQNQGTLEKLVKTLPSNVGILNLEGYILVGGKKQPILLSPKNTFDLDSILKEYALKETELLDIILDFKKQGIPQEYNDFKPELEKLINEFSTQELSSSVSYSQKFSSFIQKATLIGKDSSLSIIKNNSFFTSFELTTQSVVQENFKKLDALQAKIKTANPNLSDEEVASKVMEKSVEVLSKTNNNSNVTKVAKLSEETIQKVNQIAQITGDEKVAVDSNKLTQLGISGEEIKAITSSINNFNSQPEEVRDGRKLAASIVEANVVEKEVGQTVITSNKTVSSGGDIVSKIFGNLKAEAFNWWNPTQGWNYRMSLEGVNWWRPWDLSQTRVRFWINRTIMDSIADGYGNIVNGLLGAAFAAMCGSINGVLGAACGGVAYGISWYLTNQLKYSIRDSRGWCYSGFVVKFKIAGWYYDGYGCANKY